MHRGKEICSELKSVRRRIAEENNIPLEIPDCQHQGPCPGTCPQCEKELRQLERALARRISVGKAATVAGIVLALASPAVAQNGVENGERKTENIKVVPQSKLYPVQGTIIDGKTKEPLPFCNVVVTRFENKVKVVLPQTAVTDFDGVFKMELPEGNYRLEVKYVGYKPIELPLKVSANNETIDLALECTAQLLGLSEVIICGITSKDNMIIEWGPDNATYNEMDGVPLRVQY